MTEKNGRTRVLVVDDSASVRELLVHILAADPAIDIVGCAADGEEALRMVQEKRPDVITMDLHMPNLDGIEATRLIMQACPTPVVIVSGSASRADVDASFRAIEAGALVVVQRPSGADQPAHQASASALLRAVKSMAEVKVVRRWPKERLRNKAAADLQEACASSAVSRRLALIGASTGGPAVIREILAEIPAGCAMPIVIVQHMSSGFVEGFAQWLSSASKFPVSIAKHGDMLADGLAYLAPDGFQMGITRDLRISLVRAAPEHGMCPSVSYLFRSVKKELCRNTAAVLLTGMGKDGAVELRRLKDDGAVTIVQDRSSAAVYGMPGEAIRQDAAQMILAPAEIGKVLRMFAQNMTARLPLAGQEGK
ncbi:two-component system chemotaxis response regulator CheB [Paucimonas lemoignei]|uniref:Protein-glutamate methylesterase/protein-glutamine glutaminase n=1 Tax=Paucimonas lemoignei TaxID=29443 RepID=A0A4R3HYL1_PAULE|nr:chemotaxis-specific protein-glutamate methyltransferase CheB [Paucimonas lemoignei]TCS38457.1 two-component system chemotaxis response regulator CheB [Paucimonas lemoignei]